MNPAAYVELDLAAASHNLTIVRQYAPQSKVMAVVKANAYGHGLARVAGALEKADAFAVARVEEGILLRQAGIKQRIIVLQGFGGLGELQAMAAFDLEAVIHTPSQLDELEKAELAGSVAVWLKIDTGMNRLGFRLEEVAQAYQRLERLAGIIKNVSLMTHLASADEKTSDFTGLQIERFKRAVAGYSNECSIANSAGILGWREALSDWVRPGIMLYGISPFPDVTASELRLKPVMSLNSRLIAVKAVKKGETVGYSNSWRCAKDTTIGIISAGYGDGYPRQARLGTPVLLNNQRVPLIGRVSMDMISVDLETMPDAKPGDKVTLWGQGLPAEEIAVYADTIPYTLICGVTQRVHIIEI